MFANDLKEKTILITGASRGIGRAIAQGFLETGSIVYGTGSREESIQGLEGSGIIGRIADVRKEDVIHEIISEIVSKHGRLDCLINNAGISTNTPAASFKEEEMENVINTNFKGVFRACQAYYKHQRKSGGGVIINVSSILGLVGYQLSSIYSGTKGAVIQLTKSLAIEWASAGFRVNAICPGFIETDMTARMQKNKSIHDHAVANIPLKRLGLPDEMAGAALFLASDASKYMTGQTIVIDGGLTAQ